jgi:adenosine deaminase
MKTSISRAMLQQCPKAELHYHLDGSLRIQTILELAQQDRVALPTTDLAALTRLVRVGSACSSLVEFLEAYKITLSVLQTRQALERCSFEAFELCREDGVSYVEGRFCPALHCERGLTAEQALEAVLEGSRRAQAVPGLRTGVIVCAMRHHAPAEGLELARLAARYAGRGVVGFDIAGPEAGFPAAQFREAYEIARGAGLGLTAHAGEADGWHSVESAIRDLGVARVGHGVALRDSSAVTQARS